MVRGSKFPSILTLRISVADLRLANSLAARAPACKGHPLISITYGLLAATVRWHLGGRLMCSGAVKKTLRWMS